MPSVCAARNPKRWARHGGDYVSPALTTGQNEPVIATDDEIQIELAHLLGSGVLSEEEAAAGLADNGIDLGSDPIDRLNGAIQFDGSFTVVPGGIAWIPAFLDGTRWSVFVDADDAAEDFVRTTPALEPLIWWMISGEVRIIDASGTVIGAHETDDLDDNMTDIVSGPKGWLTELAGQWAQVTVTNGALQWAPMAAKPDVTERQAAAVRAGFESTAYRQTVNEFAKVTADEEPKELVFTTGGEPLFGAFLSDHEAFVAEPIPPISELYEAAGLEVRDATIARRGFNWDALDEWRARNMAMWELGIDEQEANLLGMLLGHSQLVVDGDSSAFGIDAEERAKGAAALAAILEENATVAGALWSHAEQTERPPAELLAFADALIATLGLTPPGVAWLRSRCLDSMGRVKDAEQALEVVLTDTSHTLTLIDAAAFAADRGDAKGALRLLERAGTVEYFRDQDELATHPALGVELLQEVFGYATNTPRPMAKRNDRCPCGSGKKYKTCHLGQERHSLEDRSSWLYDKARRFLRQNDGWFTDELAELITMHAADSEQMDSFLDSEFTADLALHEGEELQEFLSERDELLPDDEALLAAQWMLVDRGLFEVERTGEDFIELLDIGRGEHVTVTNTNPSDYTRPGIVLMGRPLPVGDTWRAFGGFVEIPRTMVKPMLTAIDSGDPFAIAELLGTSFAPPQMANTDGEELVFHQLEWLLGYDFDASPDVSTIDTALISAGFRREDREGDPAWSLIRDTENQQRTYVSTLLLEDGLLKGEANSDARAEELIELIAAALPDSELDDDNVRTVEQAIEFHKAMREIDPDYGDGEIDQTDPAIQAALAEHILEYEKRWLDDSIPALGGLTPREAAADPVKREELAQLLKSFPRPTPEFTGMDPDRIREALGLD